MGRRAAAIAGPPPNDDEAQRPGTEDLSAFVALIGQDARARDIEAPAAVSFPASDASFSAPAEPSTTEPSTTVSASALPAPRSRREARERLRAVESTTTTDAEVHEAAEAAPSYPSRRALRQSRSASATVPDDSQREDAARRTEFAGRTTKRHSRSSRPRSTGNRRLETSRRPALIAGSAALALIPGLMFAAPANAAESISPEQLKATIDSNTKLIAQKLQVSAAVAGGPLQKENYVAGAIAGIVAAESGPNGAEVAVALAEALQYGGAREKIVETALTYLGDPYELGGASHDGIDCSGLTMVAYATVGVSLVHYVPTQDAAATPISQADAQPGDLVFFNDDEHVALYLGSGMIIEAPDYGIPVRIVSLSTWSGIGYHFGRILHD